VVPAADELVWHGSNLQMLQHGSGLRYIVDGTSPFLGLGPALDMAVVVISPDTTKYAGLFKLLQSVKSELYMPDWSLEELSLLREKNYGHVSQEQVSNALCVHLLFFFAACSSDCIMHFADGGPHRPVWIRAAACLDNGSR
jgi:hypothetical protein